MHGRCIAANAGVRHARGTYLVLHDDDDLWHPDFLVETVRFLDAHPNDSGVVVKTDIVYERSTAAGWREVARVPFWTDQRAITFVEMLSINRAVPIAFLYRRGVHDDVGLYDETLDAVEDWELSLRILARGSIGYIPRTLAYWTQRPEASGRDANSMYALADRHRHDDAVVRDRALREYVARDGLALPLYVGGEFAALRTFIKEELNKELDRRHPLAALVRRALLHRRRRQGRRA